MVASPSRRPYPRRMPPRTLAAAAAAAAATLIAATGCGTDDDPPAGDEAAIVDRQNGACIALEGRQFQSVEQHECGLTPNGPAMCHWQLEFTPTDPQRSSFMWRHSDVGESGAVRCTGRQITTDGFGPVYTGTYDPATRRLTWVNLAYEPR
jgi:hypothetical protein